MSSAPDEITALLEEMFAPDGYHAVVETWPAGDRGRARIRVVAGDTACADCLVPKDVMRIVLANELPAGIEVSNDDLIYPGEA